ncbi:MAG: VTT domain-containing protein [Nanoarchaeota archaeon]|nr:VTT domain-containing protein [Nanoarchaeota archaeon]
MKIRGFTQSFNALLLLSVIVLSVYLLSLGQEKISTMALGIGYFGIFIFTFLLDVSFQILSPDIFLISGIIAGMNFIHLTTIVIIASWISGIVAYYLGITHSKIMLDSVMSRKRSRKALAYFKKYGKFGMALIALTPIPYLPILGGIFRMKIKDFIIYALLIRALHFLMIAYIITRFV